MDGRQYGNVKALATRNAIYGGGRLGIPACDSALRPLWLGFWGAANGDCFRPEAPTTGG
jgi:hypothetical protein